jgi:hypothetical protein
MVSYEACVRSDLFLLSYPINDAISIASDACNIDINDWSASRNRGIWTRTAATWKRRAESVDVAWGTKGQLGGRRAEVTAKIKVVSGGSISCRPLELVNASPPCLPIFPSQVLIITVASEAMVTNTQNTGIPRVGFSRTVPEPADTVPVAGTGTHRTVIDAVSYETRGTIGTRGSYTSTFTKTSRSRRARQLTWPVRFVRC